MTQQKLLTQSQSFARIKMIHAKSWFVYFNFTDHEIGKTVRKQFRTGINKFQQKAVKEK